MQSRDVRLCDVRNEVDCEEVVLSLDPILFRHCGEKKKLQQGIRGTVTTLSIQHRVFVIGSPGNP